jgi:hypothetical protein
MRTNRFGRKIKLPTTIAIKHQLRKLMFEDSVKKAETEAWDASGGIDGSGARAKVFRGQPAKNCSKTLT